MQEADHHGRDFAIEPVLLFRQSRPGIRHARVAVIGRLPFRSLGQLQAVLSVVSEDIRLFHTLDLGTEPLARNRPYGIVTSAGTLHVAGHWMIMRIFVAIILAFITTAALADSTGEQMRGDAAPTATDVISGLYSFSRFQQGLLESTDLRGNAEVKNLAALRAEEAAKRDKALKAIQDTIGAEPRVSKATSSGISLAKPDDEGPAYVRTFYAAQIPEYESAITLLERYLRTPDNPALAAFAREHLPVLRVQLKDAERTMADK